MNLTTQQLEQLKIMAGLFFSVQDILIALEIPLYLEEEFSNLIICEKEHPVFQAYHKGRLTAETQLRQAIRQAALNGSNPAQSTMLEFYNKSKP
jgi:hypothetical protein